MWTKKTLEDFVRDKLSGYKFIIVSNRQPVVHSFQKGKIVAKRGVGGVITALNPVIRASSGTWIASSDGDADRQVCDPRGRCQIGDPQGGKGYTLKRLWLTKKEMEGYYYGYSNSTLWPLCHMSFKRPVFRIEDWEAYVQVNEKFADAVLEEAGEDKAFVWIQD
ncbi:MAG: trehalose-6-phosphate synthase, partial [Elusimicrobia bacterium]|nr:trehalose-6-phosphate synthase [Elusimicrobiota bacterium]